MSKKVYRLTPAVKDNLWGGNKLRAYGKQSAADRIAESWELSFTAGGEATIEDGRKMSEAFGREAWGSAAARFEFFPVLTKFIDAREKLSVQVHPSDAYALEHEGQYGKTEMWYVVEAEPGAGLYMGLNRPATKEEFAAAVADGTVEQLLSFKQVKSGDVFFIPSGTVHAIGEGVLIFEIQQNSTLTYRLYDYMRRDKDGNLRELHVDKAMLVSNLSEYDAAPRDEKNPDVIGKCEYFETRKYKLNFTNSANDANKKFNVDGASFVAFTCIGGEGEICGERFSRGDTFFAPAGVGMVEVSTTSELEFVTVSVPDDK